MKKFFDNIRKYYKYAVRSAKAELKSEVTDSYLNWLWWIIEPFAFMVIYTFVFGYIFKNHTPYFASFVMIGVTCWDFFNRMISGSVKLIINNRELVKKVYIPKYILLLSKSFTYMFKMAISMVLCLGLMAFQGVPLTWHILFVIPIFIIIYLLSFGIGLILMNYGVSFDDLHNLTNIGLRMLFYLSGIFYNLRTRLSGSLAYYLLRLNPFAFLISEMRKVMIENRLPSFQGLGVWLVVSIFILIVGIRIINKNENSYAKVI